MDRIFQAFRKRQCEEGMALAAESDRLELIPLDGSAPHLYRARFDARGLIRDRSGRVVEADGFEVGIRFPEDYLRRAHSGQVLTYLGPHRRPWHPNIHMNKPFICLHMDPATKLVDLLYSCLEIWTWNLFQTGDNGLNSAASQWARRQGEGRFPIDRRPLKRLRSDAQAVMEGAQA